MNPKELANAIAAAAADKKQKISCFSIWLACPL